MKTSELNYLDQVINLAFDNAIANTRNGTSYQYYWENPALKQERLKPGKIGSSTQGNNNKVASSPFDPELISLPDFLEYGAPGQSFRNVRDSSESFKLAKPSAPYMVYRKDDSGQVFLDGEETQRNIFQGNAYFQKKAYEQMGEARARQAVPRISPFSDKEYSLRHPVIGNPGKKLAASPRNTFGYKLHSPWHALKENNFDPRRQVPVEPISNEKRSHYDAENDRIYTVDHPSLGIGERLPQPYRAVPDAVQAVERFLQQEDLDKYPSKIQPHNIHTGIMDPIIPITWDYRYENSALEEGVHAMTPSHANRNLPKNNDPNAFAPKDKSEGERDEPSFSRSRRLNVPFVPGMQNAYEQTWGEFVKGRAFDQYDAQSTYGHRIQNASELLDYHNMHKVYGTEGEWLRARLNLTRQHAASLGMLRAKSIEQNINEYQRELKEYEEGSRKEPPVPLERRPLRPVESIYRFIDESELMKQVRNGRGDDQRGILPGSASGSLVKV